MEIVIGPEESLAAAGLFKERVKFFQILGVHPGPAGQEILEETFERIKKMRKICPASPAGGPSCIIEANGGMNKETAKKAVEAGANIIVAAKAIFGAEDIKKAIEELKTISNI